MDVTCVSCHEAYTGHEGSNLCPYCSKYTLFFLDEYNSVASY